MPVISVIPTISTSAYTTGDVIGGKLTLKSAIGRRILLTDIVIYDDDGEGVQLDFFFFKDDLTGTTGYIDNAAFAVNAADKVNCVGYASVLTTDYIAAGTDKVGKLTPINLLIDRGTSDIETLYSICVIRSTTTYTTTSDLRFDFAYIEER